MSTDIFNKPPSLEGLFPEKPVTETVPQSTIRNQASTAAVLSKQEPVEVYQKIMQEREAGYKQTYDAIINGNKEEIRQINTKALTDILSDPKVPFEKKRLAADAIRFNRIDTSPETSVILQSAQEESSPEETTDDSEVRLSFVDNIAKNRGSVSDSQALVNAFVATHDIGGTGRQISEVAATYLAPFANQAFTTQVYEQLTGRKLGEWEKLKANFFPGSITMKMREWYMTKTPQERKDYLVKLQSSITKAEGLIIDNNTFEKIMKQQEIVEADGYNDFQKWADNVAAVLDVAGIGFIARDAKLITKAAKGGNKTELANALFGADFFKPKLEKPPRIDPTFGPVKGATNAPTNVRTLNVKQSDLAKVSTPNLEGPVLGDRISELEVQRAEMLGDSSTLAERGDVRQMREELDALGEFKFDEASYKASLKQANPKLTNKELKARAAVAKEDARLDYDAKKSRLEGMLSSNASSAKNEQKLSELDEEIARLQAAKSGPELRLNPIADAIRGIELNAPLRINHPMATGNLMGLANPQKARNLHAAIVTSGNDELARAMFNTPVQDVANRVLPQFTTPNGNVTYAPPDLERTILENMFEGLPEDLKHAWVNSGNLGFTPSERLRAAAHIENKFKNADGIEVINEFSSFSSKGDGNVVVSAVYGGREGGFKTARDAVEQVAHKLSALAISERDMTVLKRDGAVLRPITKDEWADATTGEYVVRVNSLQRATVFDVGNMEPEVIKYSWFDGIRSTLFRKSGSVTRHLVNPLSIFKISAPAAVRATLLESKFEKHLLDLHSDFAKDFNSLSKDRKNKMKAWMDYAKQNEIDYHPGTLTAQGFTNFEIAALAKFRKYWDAQYTLENYDLVTTLRNQRYERLVSPNADFIVKKVPKNQNIIDVYDPVLDQSRPITKAEMDSLYNSNGYIAQLRRPAVVNGNKVDHVIVANTPTAYTRVLNDADKVLNYKKGYFQTYYRAPIFITETENGITKAIAVAGDSRTAEAFRKRKESASNGATYGIRPGREETSIGSDEYWDVSSAGGRIAQRHRGKQLENADAPNQLGDSTYVVDPVEAGIRAARSIAGRTVGRETLETIKARFMNQFDHLLPEVQGQKKFPSNIDEIMVRTTGTDEDVTKARTMFEYAQYLENAYVNGADELVKGLFNKVANSLGKRASKGSKTAAVLERGARIASENANPFSLAKNFTFTAWIANHPLRQLVIQSHQIIRLFGYSGVYAAGDIAKGGSIFLKGKLKGKQALTKDELQFFEWLDESGALSAIAKQNLVRGPLLDAAELGNVAVRGVKKTLSTVRRVGFDTGEMANQMGHMSAVYYKYIRDGADMDNPSVRAKAAVEANAISYSMNFADDMPYNQNTLGILFQFMQAPHKALLQTTNQAIPPVKRLTLLAADTLMWGAPSAAIYSIFSPEDLPEDPGVRDAILEGVEFALLNTLFAMVSDTKYGEIDIDVSSLDPRDVTGFGKFFSAIYEEGFDTVITNSPAGSLFLKDTGPVQTFISKFMSFVSSNEEYIADPVEMKDVAMAGARALSSGVSSMEKAVYMLQTERRLDARGNPVDETAQTMEAIAQVFGFGSYDQKLAMEMSMKLSKEKKSREKELNLVYKRIMSHYTNVGDMDNRSQEHTRKIVNHMLSVYRNDEFAIKYLMGRWQQELTSGNSKLVIDLMRASGFIDKDDLMKQIDKGIRDPEKRRKTMELVNAAYSMGAGK